MGNDEIGNSSIERQSRHAKMGTNQSLASKTRISNAEPEPFLASLPPRGRCHANRVPQLALVPRIFPRKLEGPAPVRAALRFGALGVCVISPSEIHDGKQRLKASNHFGFPCNRMRRVSKAHKRFRSPARNPSHVSESAMTLMLGLPSSPFSTVNFPSQIVTVASAGSLPVETKW